MENQHRQIKGYRELSQDEINLMNKIKEQGLALEALMAEVNTHLLRQKHAAEESFLNQISDAEIEKNRLWNAEPIRWYALGKTDIQKGLMFLTRAVAQPTSF